MNTTQNQNSTATAGGHTPGPWNISREDFRTIEAFKTFQDGAQHPVPVAIMVYPFPLANRAESDANARLIAQCPSMYDYIAKRATLGDVDAIKIIDSLR